MSGGTDDGTIRRAEVSFVETAADDPRLGRWLSANRDVEAAEVVLVGFPSDEGVRRNGGRPGAADGPRAIREALYKLTPDARLGAMRDLLDRAVDLGDVRVTGDVEADQTRLGAIIEPLLQKKKTVIVLGGGHETAFGHLLGYKGLGYDSQRPDVLNIDAHLDVRPLRDAGNGPQAHSGSPFRQGIEAGHIGRYTAVGVQPHSAAATHVGYVEAHGGRVVWRDETMPDRLAALIAEAADPTLATLDLDGLCASVAPGVSAPNPGGLPAEVWLDAAEALGANPNVRSLDVVELNPRVDLDGRTARIAALSVWRFLRGRARSRHHATTSA